jgi:hypothetical protein
VFNKSDSIFTGVWYTYHYTYENQELVFRKEKWTIKLTVRGYYAETFDDERHALKFKGKLEIGKDSSLMVEMKGVGTTEKYYAKINYPFPNKEQRTFAIIVGIDFDSNKVATMYLFSRKPLNEDDAKTLIEKKLNAEDKFLRI